MGADPTWPNRTRYSIPCEVTLGSGGGGARRELSRGLGGRGAGPVQESGCLGRAVHCCVFSLFVPLLFLFPSVCCSVKLPLSRPTSFCLFLFILLRTPAGGWGGCVALLLPAAAETKTFEIGAQTWGTDNGRAEQRLLKLLSYILLNFVIRIFLC